MVIPSPRTWTVGEVLTAAKLNVDVRDGLNFLLSPPWAVMRKSAAQSIANSTIVLVTWDVEDIDRDNGHNNAVNNTRYTSQTAGWYFINGAVRWSSTAGDLRTFDFRKTFSGGGTEQYSIQSGTALGALMRGTIHLFLAVGDYVEIFVTQASGGAVNTSGSSALEQRWEVRWISTT